MELATMTKKNLSKNLSLLSVSVALALTAGTAQASLGNLGSTFGLTPVDIASAQSFSLFNSQSSAAYYNPSALSATDQGEMYLGFLSATPDITAGDKSFDEATQPLVAGMNVNVTSLFNFSYPIYFGLIAGIENYGTEMMAFNSETSVPTGTMIMRPRYRAVDDKTVVPTGYIIWNEEEGRLNFKIDLEVYMDSPNMHVTGNLSHNLHSGDFQATCRL
jgi:hypothetical protein